jgi:hypothetical protein
MPTKCRKFIGLTSAETAKITHFIISKKVAVNGLVRKLMLTLLGINLPLFAMQIVHFYQYLHSPFNTLT